MAPSRHNYPVAEAVPNITIKRGSANHNWLVFQPIWKILVKMGSSSPGRGENKKCLSCHHLDNQFISETENSSLFFQGLGGSKRGLFLFQHSNHLFANLPWTSRAGYYMSVEILLQKDILLLSHIFHMFLNWFFWRFQTIPRFPESQSTRRLSHQPKLSLGSNPVILCCLKKRDPYYFMVYDIKPNITVLYKSYIYIP